MSDQDNNRAMVPGEALKPNTFTLPPEGIYEFRVNSVTNGRVGGSPKMCACETREVKIQIETPEGGKMVLSEKFFLHSFQAASILACHASIGLCAPDAEDYIPQWDWSNTMEGKRGRIKLGHRRFEKRDDAKGYPTGLAAEVAAWLAPLETTQVSGSTVNKPGF